MLINKKLIEASKKAGIYVYVASLPEVFDTIMHDNGKEMSQGQRSRICLAIAFYRQKPILLLDEIFASLDDLTINQILVSLESILDSETFDIMITHSTEHIPKDAKIILL